LMDFRKQGAGIVYRRQGNERVPGNEGVGEHVRTRFHLGLWAR
jgi:hypothetical protein